MVINVNWNKFVPISAIKSRHSTIVEESTRGISEPVRGVTARGGARLRGISIKYLKKAVALSLNYHTAVMKSFQPAYEQALEEMFGGRIAKSAITEIKYGHNYSCGCGECETKAVTPDEAERVQREFRRIFGAKLDDELNRESKAFLLKMMDSGRVNPKESRALFQDMYFETIIAAGDDAYEAALAAWKKQPQEWRDENPFTGKKTTVFQKDDAFVKKLYLDGYRLVNHAITVENLTGIREIMNNSLMRGLSWQQTASLLNSRFGTVVDEESGLVRGGGISHWQRVVRTEMATAIDKAHHDRYKGMDVEFVTMSVSPTACPICMWYKEQNRGFYPIDEAPDITEDTHPNCFINSMVPIYTSKGWVPIHAIRPDDLVMTHMGRFRKVLRVLEEKFAFAGEEIFVFKYKMGERGGTSLTSAVTGEHPFLTQRGWVKAQEIVIGDRILSIALPCLDCGKPIGQRRNQQTKRCKECDSSFNSKITKEQWQDEGHRIHVSNKNREANLKQYATGKRDRFQTTRRAQEVTRELVKQGKQALQQAETRRLSRIALSKGHNQSGIEKKMKTILNKMGLEFDQRLMVPKGKDSLGKQRYYFPDFFLKGTNILIECDGEKWHDLNDPKEIERQKHLEGKGYRVLRFWGKQISYSPDKVAEEIKRVYLNDTHKYSFRESEVVEIERKPIKKTKKLYNFSVEEDESYIANGVVVHNCRCVFLPVFNLNRGINEDHELIPYPGK